LRIVQVNKELWAIENNAGNLAAYGSKSEMEEMFKKVTKIEKK